MSTYHPGLIRLVASRYRDLQGLLTVADAALLLMPGATLYLHRLGWVGSPWLYGCLGCYAAYGWARFTVIQRRIDAYYANRCGRVELRLGRPFMFPLYMQGTLGAAILVDVGLPAPLRVALVLLLLAGLPGRIVVRDWPYRVHWLMPFATGVVLAVLFAAVTTKAQAKAWLPGAALACGTSLALAGLLDHALLIKTLHAPPSDQPERAQVQAP